MESTLANTVFQHNVPCANLWENLMKERLNKTLLMNHHSSDLI